MTTDKENTLNNSIKKVEISSPIWRKWLLWSSLSFFIAVITAILFLSYNHWIQQKIVKKISNDLEKIDFTIDEVEFNFWTNTLYLKTITIDYHNDNIKGSDKLIKVSVQGIGWYNLLVNNKINVNEVNLENDVFDYKTIELIKKKQINNLKSSSFQNKIPVSIKNINFSSNLIHFQNDTLEHFISKNTFSLKNIYIDSVKTEIPWKTFSLNLENYTLLNKKDTLFYSKNIQFTQKDSTLIIQNIAFFNKKNKAVFIKEIDLQKIEINQFVKTKKLYLDAFYIQEAYLNLNKLNKREPTNLQEFNLQKALPKLLKPFCEELKINSFSIKKSDINYTSSVDTKKINNITFSLKNIHIHDRSYLDKKKILFSDSINVGFEDFVSNNQHYSLSFLLGNIHINSNDTIFYFYDFHYAKNEKLSVFIPQFSIKNINWKKLWQEKIIDIESILVQSPELSMIAENTNDKSANAPKSLNEMILKIGKGLQIQHIQVRNATFSYQNKSKIRPVQKALIERVNLNLKNIAILSSSPLIKPHNLLEKIISLDGKNIDFELKNNTKLSIEKLALSSNLKDFVLSEFSFKKDTTLSAYSKSLIIQNINWNKYWKSKKFEIDKILLAAPSITLINNLEKRKKKKIVSNTENDWKKILPNLVNSFANSVKIKEVSLQKGNFSYQIRKENNSVNKQYLKHLDIKLHNINIPNEIFDSINYLPLYSDNIELKGKNYAFKASKNNIKLDSFFISTAQKNIIFYELQVSKNNNIDFCLPVFKMENIDWFDYWNHHILTIGYLSIDKPNLFWKKEKKKRKKLNFKIEDFDDIRKETALLLSPFFENIKLKDFSIQEAGITIEDGKNIHNLRDLEIQAHNFELDSTKKFIDNYKIIAQNYHFQNEKSEQNILKLIYTSSDSTISTYGFENRTLSNSSHIKSYKIRLEKIHLSKLIEEQKIYAENLKIYSPNFFIDATKNTDSIQKIDWKKLHQKIGFKNFEIKNFSTNITKKDRTNYYISSGNLTIKEFEIDTTWAWKNSFKNLKINFHNATSNNPTKLYQTEIGHFYLNFEDSIMDIQNLKMMPTVSDITFFETIEQKKSIYKINIPKIFSHNFNCYELLHNKKISIHHLLIKDANFELFNDKRIHKDADYIAPIPNDLVRQQIIDFQIDSIFANNATILYKEQVINSDSVGVISFHKTDLTLANFHNQSHYGHFPLLVKGQSLFMNKGLLKINLEFDLFSEKLQCHYMATLENMSVIPLNEILSPNSIIALKKGEIKHIKVDGIMFGNENKGNMFAKYKNIRIELYQKKARQEKLKILSIFGNMLLNNTQRQRKRSKIYYVKDKQDSFIKFLWLGIKNGLEKTLLPMKKK